MSLGAWLDPPKGWSQARVAQDLKEVSFVLEYLPYCEICGNTYCNCEYQDEYSGSDEDVNGFTSDSILLEEIERREQAREAIEYYMDWTRA